MRVFTKIDGILACWHFEGDDYADAISAVRGELSVKHSGAVLALIKY